MLPTISQEKVALITDECNVYMAGAVDTDDTDCAEERVDHYRQNVSREISPFYSSEGCQKSLVMQMYNEAFPQIRSQSLQRGPIQVM